MQARPPAPPQSASQVAGPSRRVTLPRSQCLQFNAAADRARGATAPAPTTAPAADTDAGHSALMGRNVPDAAQAAALEAAAAPGGQDTAGPGELAAAAEALEWVVRAVAQEKLGDIMFMPPRDALCIGDVSVVNPCADTYCGCAAREDGGAAETRDVQKRNAYRLYDPDAYSFVPLSHETHGRLGQPGMNHLNRLAEVAFRCGVVQRKCYCAPCGASILGWHHRQGCGTRSCPA